MALLWHWNGFGISLHLTSIIQNFASFAKRHRLHWNFSWVINNDMGTESDGLAHCAIHDWITPPSDQSRGSALGCLCEPMRIRSQNVITNDSNVRFVKRDSSLAIDHWTTRKWARFASNIILDARWNRAKKNTPLISVRIFVVFFFSIWQRQRRGAVERQQRRPVARVQFGFAGRHGVRFAVAIAPRQRHRQRRRGRRLLRRRRAVVVVVARLAAQPLVLVVEPAAPLVLHRHRQLGRLGQFGRPRRLDRRPVRWPLLHFALSTGEAWSNYVWFYFIFFSNISLVWCQ